MRAVARHGQMGGLPSSSITKRWRTDLPADRSFRFRESRVRMPSSSGASVRRRSRGFCFVNQPDSGRGPDHDAWLEGSSGHRVTSIAPTSPRNDRASSSGCGWDVFLRLGMGLPRPEPRGSGQVGLSTVGHAVGVCRSRAVNTITRGFPCHERFRSWGERACGPLPMGGRSPGGTALVDTRTVAGLSRLTLPPTHRRTPRPSWSTRPTWRGD